MKEFYFTVRCLMYHTKLLIYANSYEQAKESFMEKFNGGHYRGLQINGASLQLVE